VFSSQYLYFSALAGIFIGSNNFMIDYSVKQIDSYRVFCLTGFGMLFYFSLYHVTQAMQLYSKKGHFWSKEDSNYYLTEYYLGREEDKRYKINKKLVRLILLRYVCSLVANIFIVFIFRTAILSGVNSSIIISLFSATSVITSIMFYFIFGERLKKQHLVGIIFLIISVSFIANA
jgi:drug/metabolite transporter (DMT)-like permease